MTNLIIQNYKSEILERFKWNFKSLASRKIQMNKIDLINTTLDEFNIVKFKSDDILFLEKWFDLIYSQEFLTLLILDHPTSNEFIFHTNETCQIISSDDNKFINLSSLTVDEFQLSLEILANQNNIAWNFSCPFQSFQIQKNHHNFRATLVHHSLTPNSQSKLFLRKHSNFEFSIQHFSVEKEIEKLINQLLADKKNLLISGSTGSGKTTLLKTLVKEIPSSEHVIILEDTHEIDLKYPNITNLLSDEKFINKSLKEYCTYAMRMSPDRLILGEMRGHEVIPFLLAMNTGHKGLMSTIHSNSATDAIHRLNLLFGFFSGQSQINPEYITRLICQNIDYVIHIEKNKIIEVAKILGAFENTPMIEVVYQLSS